MTSKIPKIARKYTILYNITNVIKINLFLLF